MPSSTHYIRPDVSPLGSYLRSCLQHGHLIWVFAQRDLRIKYAQTWIGLAWTLMQPLVFVLLYALVFGSLFGDLLADDLYLEKLCIGVVAWSLFYYVAQQSSTAWIQHKDLIEKIAFPRLLLLLSKAGVGLVDFVLAFALLCVFLMIRGALPTINYLYVPLAVGSLLVQGLCVGVWFSALSIRWRDLQHILPMLLHALLWLSPVFYTRDRLEGPLLGLVGLNPISESLALLRWSLIGTEIDLPYLGLRTLLMSVLLLWGIIVLKKVERTLCDVL